MSSPCKSIVDEAKKKLSIFSKDEWSAALLFIKAAECFLSEGNKKDALKNALKAADILKKLAKKADIGTVLPDIEKALRIAYNAAEDEKVKREISEELFGTIMLRAQMAITSGDYAGAALYYKRAIEYAPTGYDAREAIQRAITNLSQLAERKMSLGMHKQATKIMNIVEDFKALLEVAEEETKVALPKKTLRVIFRTEEEFDSVKNTILGILTDRGFSEISTKDEANHVAISAKMGDTSVTFKVSKEGGNIIMEVSSTSDNDLFEYSESLKDKIIEKLLRTKITEQEIEGEVSRETLIALLNKTKEEILLGTKYNIVLKNLDLAARIMKDKKIGNPKPIEELLKKYSNYIENLLQLEEIDEFLDVVRSVLSKLGG